MRTSFLACSRYTAIFALIFIVAVGAGAYAQVSNPVNTPDPAETWIRPEIPEALPPVPMHVAAASGGHGTNVLCTGTTPGWRNH